jgi:hypothetical protein
MEHQLDDERVVRSYLLGELSEEDREQLERQMLVDGDYSSFVSALEEELIEDYVSGRFEAEDVRKFERVFLTTPSGAERVRLARNLRAYARKKVSEKLQGPSPRLAGAAPGPISLTDYLRSKSLAHRIALAAAGLVILVGASLIFTIWKLQERIDSPGLPPKGSQVQQLEEQLAEQQARNDELARSLQQEQERRLRLEQELTSSKTPKPENPSSLLAAIVLSPGKPRAGEQSKVLIIRPGVSQAAFRLRIRKTSYTSFKVSIRTEDGREVWSGLAQSSAGGTEVRFSVPADRFSNAKCLIHLQGTSGQGGYEDMPTYYFTVVKRRA